MKDYKALELQMLRMCPRSADITERTAKALQKALGISMPISFAVRATCLTLGQIEEERLGNCAIYTTTRKGIERLKEAKD